MCCLSFAGRVLSQSTPGTPSKTITISESGVIGSTLNTTTQTPNKIAISPLKSPNKVKNLTTNAKYCGQCLYFLIVTSDTSVLIYSQATE